MAKKPHNESTRNCVTPDRRVEAHPSSAKRIKKSRFTEFMVTENGLDRVEFSGWVFYPGMLFKASDKWWGDQGKRGGPHEGLDLCFYKGGRGGVLRLDEKMRVPVMYDGTVVGIIDDFLGKSVIVEHSSSDCGEIPYLTLYGHTVPDERLLIGGAVKEGDVISTLADAGGSGSSALTHLHISVARTTRRVPYDGLDWKTIADPKAFTMIDPLDLIGGPYAILPTRRVR